LKHLERRPVQVEDLDHTTYLDALGLPGQHGGVEKQVRDDCLS
jgi:hypothetical protein